MFRYLFAVSRYLIFIPVIGSFLASVLILVFGLLDVLRIGYRAVTQALFTHTFDAKHIAVESIEIIDLFLLGTVLYIIALGLYALFIDSDLPMPVWLVIHTLDDLKVKLLEIVVVLLAVTFLSNIVSWNGNLSILALGLAVGLVLLALGYLLSRSFRKQHDNG